MRPSNNSTNYKHQAGDKDYKYNIDFDRGHLFPSSYGSTVLKINSTFTLTNIVPQNKDFNSGSWNKMENCIKCVLNEYCKNNSNIEGFVVIGAQPSNNRLNQRISIPSVLWSTFCCYSQIQNSWLASATEIMALNIWIQRPWENSTKSGEYKYFLKHNVLKLQQLLICIHTFPLTAPAHQKCQVNLYKVHISLPLKPLSHFPPHLANQQLPL